MTDINIDEYLEDLQTYLDNGEEEKMYWQEDMQVLISELKETRKQLKKLENKNKDLLRKLRNRVKEVKKLIKYSAYKKEFSKLNTMLKQKGRQIDLMAEHIERGCDFDSRIQTKEQIKQYFTEQAKEVEK